MNDDDKAIGVLLTVFSLLMIVQHSDNLRIVDECVDGARLNTAIPSYDAWDVLLGFVAFIFGVKVYRSLSPEKKFQTFLASLIATVGAATALVAILGMSIPDLAFFLDKPILYGMSLTFIASFAVADFLCIFKFRKQEAAPPSDKTPPQA